MNLWRLALTMGLLFWSGEAADNPERAWKRTRTRPNFVSDAMPNRYRRQLRGSTLSLSTTKCSAIRQDNYQGELQLIYSYEVEFSAGSSRSLNGISDALSYAVAKSFSSCDILHRPEYKVRTNIRHEISKDGKWSVICIAKWFFFGKDMKKLNHISYPTRLNFPDFCAPGQMGDICFVVTGGTAILLDSNASFAQEIAYQAIAEALSNLDFLRLFSPYVARAEFLHSLRESLVIPSASSSSSGSGTITATVAIATASVIFVAVSMFCYGIARQEFRSPSKPSFRHRRRLKNRRPKEKQQVSVAAPTSRLARNSIIGIHRKTKNHFVPLNDSSSFSQTDFHKEETKTDQLNLFQPDPTVTWSVSDITSDSCSLLSSMSRRLASIVEEHDDDNSCGNGHEIRVSRTTQSERAFPPRRESAHPDRGDTIKRLPPCDKDPPIFRESLVHVVSSSRSSDEEIDVDPPNYDNFEVDEISGGRLPSITVSTIDDDAELDSKIFDIHYEDYIVDPSVSVDDDFCRTRRVVNDFDASVAHLTVMSEPSISHLGDSADVSQSNTDDDISTTSSSSVSTVVGMTGVSCALGESSIDFETAESIPSYETSCSSDEESEISASDDNSAIARDHSTLYSHKQEFTSISTGEGVYSYSLACSTVSDDKPSKLQLCDGESLTVTKVPSSPKKSIDSSVVVKENAMLFNLSFLSDADASQTACGNGGEIFVVEALQSSKEDTAKCWPRATDGHSRFRSKSI